MKTAIGTFGAEAWFGGDVRSVTEVVKIADDLGVDQVITSEHVVMGPNHDKYPYGPFPATFDHAWIEPMAHLSLLAGVTKRIRLATGILISPIRPAAVLAKQIATLDYLSHGRAHIGIGYGWQKEELEACGVAWKDKFDIMVEQVHVCRKLWSEGPTDFHGKFVNFDEITCFPFPVQKPFPLGFGVAPTDKNIAVIAELGDAWLPMEVDPVKLAEPIRKIKAAFTARGRDPNTLEVRTTMRPVMTGNGVDLDATLATVPAYAEVGVTCLNFHPTLFATDLKDFAKKQEKIEQAVKG
jgi:probable F420-dependent oxidoreductase